MRKYPKYVPKKRHVNARTLGLCFNCLSQSHQLKDGLSKATFRMTNETIATTYFFTEKKQRPSPTQLTFATNSRQERTTRSKSSQQKRIIQVVPVTVDSLSPNQPIYALLDNGNTGCFMSPQLAKRLELKHMETSDVTMRGFNSRKNSSIKTVPFHISDTTDSERFNCQNIMVVDDFHLTNLKTNTQQTSSGITSF